jgi:hypothetical protein
MFRSVTMASSESVIRTCHEFIAALAEQSAAIAAMALHNRMIDATLGGDAFNLANCAAHRRLIARAVDGLISNGFSSVDNVTNLVANVLRESSTYGAFAELAGYEWFMRFHMRIQTHTLLSASDVLGTSGSTLDGRIEHGGAYFDIKAFGFHGYLANRLKERLEKELPGEQVFVEESWDVSYAAFSQLISDAPVIAAELKQKRFLRKGRLHLRIGVSTPVTVSSRLVEPYLLAKENALYPFVDAHQFTRHHPFILLFVFHPWYNFGAIHNDFGGVDTCFTRSLARRAFMQFSQDTKLLSTVCTKADPTATLADAARLLSAIFFVNVWPEDADPAVQRLPTWLYLNPRATHRYILVGPFRSINIHGTKIDDFSDDDY